MKNCGNRNYSSFAAVFFHIVKIFYSAPMRSKSSILISYSFLDKST